MHCALWKTLLSDGEQWLMGRGEHPVTQHPLREVAETYMLTELAQGRELGLAPAIQAVEQKRQRMTIVRDGVRLQPRPPS